jgi:hypothetical protein
VFGFEQSDKENCNKLKKEELLGNDENATRLIALARADCLMDRYLRWKMRNHRYSNLAQGVALVFTAITPVILLSGDNARIVGAATAAIAAIATGLLNFTGWRDNYIRYGYTWHSLQTEKYRYLTRATKEYLACDEDEAVRKFANRIENLVMAEVTDWRTEMQRAEQQAREVDLIGLANG